MLRREARQLQRIVHGYIELLEQILFRPYVSLRYRMSLNRLRLQEQKRIGMPVRRGSMVILLLGSSLFCPMNTVCAFSACRVDEK